MLCETTVDLIGTDDKMSWEYSICRVSDQIIQLHPAGRNLAIYSELTEFGDKFQSGCYCAATAKLAVLLAKESLAERVRLKAC